MIRMAVDGKIMHLAVDAPGSEKVVGLIAVVRVAEEYYENVIGMTLFVRGNLYEFIEGRVGESLVVPLGYLSPTLQKEIQTLELSETQGRL